MRSSSKLFPVSLMAAETIGPFNEDVYELRPGQSADPSVSLALTRITDPRIERRGPAVVFVHGEFGNRRAWLSSSGQGLAADLAEQGMDVWLAEMRGHGLSPRNRHWLDNSLSDYGNFDWPSVNAFVVEQSRQNPIWISAGLGALGVAYGLIHHGGFLARVSGACFINMPPASRWAKAWGLLQSLLLRRKGSIDGMQRGLGPEEEPFRIFEELRRWSGLARKGEHPVFDGLRRINIPTLVVNDSAVDPKGEKGRLIQGLLGARDRHFVLVPAQSGRHGKSAMLPGGPAISPGAEAAVMEWIEQRWGARSDTVAERASA